MAEILFYHLTRTPLEATLPDLLQKSRDRGWNVVVRASSEVRLAWLDEMLWVKGAADFLPHGISGGTHDARQPIILTSGQDVPNGAEILFSVESADVSEDEAAKFERVCIVIDGNDPLALDHARGQWKSLTDAGLPAKYWSQESGKWEVKVSKNY